MANTDSRRAKAKPHRLTMRELLCKSGELDAAIAALRDDEARSVDDVKSIAQWVAESRSIIAGFKILERKIDSDIKKRWATMARDIEAALTKNGMPRSKRLALLQKYKGQTRRS